MAKNYKISPYELFIFWKLMVSSFVLLVLLEQFPVGFSFFFFVLFLLCCSVHLFSLDEENQIQHQNKWFQLRKNPKKLKNMFTSDELKRVTGRGWGGQQNIFFVVLSKFRFLYGVNVCPWTIRCCRLLFFSYFRKIIWTTSK